MKQPEVTQYSIFEGIHQRQAKSGILSKNIFPRVLLVSVVNTCRFCAIKNLLNSFCRYMSKGARKRPRRYVGHLF